MVREGAGHTIWARGERRGAVPRHRELKAGTARAICNDLGITPPEGER